MTIPRRALLTIVLIGAPLILEAAPKGADAEPTAEEFLARAQEVLGRGLIKQALEFAGKAIDRAPRSPRGYYFRAHIYQRTRQFAPAESDYNRAIELSPAEAALYQDRGLVRLLMADFQGAAADFDHYAELRPSQAASLWQRGIALFYMGRFDDARRQFELHRTVNPGDVENSAWHFACLARTDGFEAARAHWMPVQDDRRVPMREIQELMTGKGPAEAVLRAANQVPDEALRHEARMYAQLYLSLFYGSEGRRDLELKSAAEAAKSVVPIGLMGEIARLHADWVASEARRTVH